MGADLSTACHQCRLCHSGSLDLLLELGNQSFTGIFPKSREAQVPSGPLSLIKCRECHLVQLGHNFDLNQLYGHTYGYRSGLNQSMVRHLRAKVDKIVTKFQPKKGDLIIDIGSNDSTLLQSYPQDDFTLVGIDPSGVKFKSFYPKTIQLIPDFFSANTVRKHLGDRKAKLITSIAMFYDLEDPMAFVNQIASLLTDDGVWTFEQSYLPAMLETLSYDTVCHEHLEYYALGQIKWMTDRAGLKIVDLEFNDVNGGSFSISVAKESAPYEEVTQQIRAVLNREASLGLHTLAPYADFAAEATQHRDTLMAFLQLLKARGKKVLGYGASTKGNVLLQYCQITESEMPYIAEVNEDKFGAFTPGTLIPIVSETEAHQMAPDYLMVLPWHFRAGILQREKAYLERGGQIIFPLPRLEVVSDQGSYFPKIEDFRSLPSQKPSDLGHLDRN